jgi:hypothetical protein
MKVKFINLSGEAIVSYGQPCAQYLNGGFHFLPDRNLYMQIVKKAPGSAFLFSKLPHGGRRREMHTNLVCS